MATGSPGHGLLLWSRSLWLNVPGGARPFALAVSAMAMIACSHLVTTAIVPGTVPRCRFLTDSLRQRGLAAGRLFGLARRLS